MVELVIAPEFWMSRMLPEGIVERWLVADGAVVKQDDPVAELKIEDKLVRLKAPATGKLCIDTRINSIVEPGSIIGHIRPVGQCKED